jgi:lysyl-tRNA synthetase class 2
MQIPQFDEIIEPNDQTRARAEHLAKLRELVGNVYPNEFQRSSVTGDADTITRIVTVPEIIKHIPQLDEGQRPSQEVKDAANSGLRNFGTVRVAGRLATPPRLMGKAAFVHLSDGISRLQIYVRKDEAQGVFNGVSPDGHGDAENAETRSLESVSVSGWEIFQLLDHGDFIGVEGFLFITNTGELSIHVEKLQFLTKAMLPMPDKMHGIEDAEIKQRQRYIDLIGSSLAVNADGLTTRGVFEARAKVISSIRRFLEDHGYIEVETPMLTPKATGAAAKPFKTHHNALDIDLYARIAPELYLKRLVVGGFEKVYELNRNFRNEGISYKHNPEFTMLEFYCAYMNVNGMMDFCEEMMKQSVQNAVGSLVVQYEGNEIDFSKFERISMKEAVHRTLAKGEYGFTINDFLGEEYDISWLDDAEKLRAFVIAAAKNKADLAKWETVKPHLVGMSAEEGRALREHQFDRTKKIWQESVAEARQTLGDSKNSAEQSVRDLVSIFEESVEENLIQPTFIVDFPKSISPLSKASPNDPRIAERFELFINRMEVANGFSELNDPHEQYERFIDQMAERERGDEEAMVLDEDYIRALSYGMPPTAGIGIGIDRLTMLLTNRHSIRDVILFPHLRPERREGETGREGEGEN